MCFQALRESRHHSAQQQSLDKQLRECVYNIRNKEDLIAALNRNDLQAKQLSQQYLVRSPVLLLHSAIRFHSHKKLHFMVHLVSRRGQHASDKV